MSCDRPKYKTQDVVQYLMAHGCVKDTDLQKMLVKNMKMKSIDQLPERSVFIAVQQVNTKLEKYHMMIRGAVDENTNEKFYVLISKVDNEVTRRAKHFTPKQLDTFKSVLEAIMHQDSKSISLDKFHELANSSKLDALQFLDELVSKRWFFKKDGKLYIGVRSIAELDVLIK